MYFGPCYFQWLLATSDLAIFDTAICILGVSKTRPLKKDSQKLVACKDHTLLVITIFKVRLLPWKPRPCIELKVRHRYRDFGNYGLQQP